MLIDTNIEHDHLPEVMDNGAGMHRLELMGLKEQLHEPASRRQLFTQLTPDGLQRLYGYANAVVQREPTSYAYEDGYINEAVESDSTPPLEDKQMLMDRTAKTVQEIAADDELDDKTALRRIGLTLAGGIGYIHPKLNANGRSVRVLHYLAEFGTERGDKAFDEETYALVAKLPVYDTDTRVAMSDMPPAELGHALQEYTKKADPEAYERMSWRERATAKTLTFLDMMRGDISVPVHKDMAGIYGIPTDNYDAIDGLSLYEYAYLRYSEIPNRTPDEVPPEANRVLAQKTVQVLGGAATDIKIPIDVV